MDDCNWFSKKQKTVSDFRANTSNAPAVTLGESLDIGDVKAATPVNALFSDATLTILSNKNNPILNVFFRDMYPVVLGALDYTQTATDVEYMTSTVDFAYQIYEFEVL